MTAGKREGELREATPFSAAFLDRDGTLIRDVGYPSDPANVELLPGAGRAVRALNRAEVPVVVVTNQSGIGRGMITGEEFRAVQAEVERQLGARAARLDAVRYCPHAPGEGCACRKPELGMHRDAARELGLDLDGALYAGDRSSDVEPAEATGGTGLLLLPSGDPRPEGLAAPCRTAPDLWSGVSALLGVDRVRTQSEGRTGGERA